MALVHLHDIDMSYGDRKVLDGVSFAVQPGEKIALVGQNGAGKSTLLGVISGTLTPDSGTTHFEGSRASLVQEPVLIGETVAEVCELSVAWHRELLANWERAIEASADDEAMGYQAELDNVGWSVDHRVDALLETLHAPPRSARTANLSGGERRRIALALTLLAQPDVLLLDEPTNHLDSEVAEWLQRFLAGYRGAIVLVTHDRYLLEAVADKVVEVEHGELVTYEGSYGDYLVQRAERQIARTQAERRRMALIAREAEWASRSPAARTTKQRARLNRLDALRDQGKLPRDADVELAFGTGRRLSGTVMEAHGLGAWVPTAQGGQRWLYKDLELSLLAKERLALLGPNGVGKSTLLSTLAGLRPIDVGTVTCAPRAVRGLLDQQRSGLNDDETLFENAGGGNDHVIVGDSAVHVVTFLERFAFRREQLDTRVRHLSGGERARLLLARLMLQGASLLLLDEPTNDLDLFTLSVLEEALRDFDGSVVLVTHDRAFLDRVATRVLTFEREGDLLSTATVTSYADRSQAMAAQQRRQAEAQAAAKALAAKAPAAPVAPKAAPKPAPTGAKKLSYKEQRQLESLPIEIEALEAEQAEIAERLGDPALYKGNGDDVKALTARAEAIPSEIESRFSLWEALAARA